VLSSTAAVSNRKRSFDPPNNNRGADDDEGSDVVDAVVKRRDRRRDDDDHDDDDDETPVVAAVAANSTPALSLGLAAAVLSNMVQNLFHVLAESVATTTNLAETDAFPHDLDQDDDDGADGEYVADMAED